MEPVLWYWLSPNRVRHLIINHRCMTCGKPHDHKDGGNP